MASEKKSQSKKATKARSPGPRPKVRPAIRPSSQKPVPVSQDWTFLSNHCHTLLVLTTSPNLPLREVALAVGITERSVQRIVSDLEEANYLKKEKVGRQNSYVILPHRHLRHPLESHCKVDQLLALLAAHSK